MPSWKLKFRKHHVAQESSSSKDNYGSHVTLPSLSSQYTVPAPASTKIRLAVLATSMVDALGGPPEFHQRFSFPLVTYMVPNSNFSLPPGVWTDDTSMTLCLARSLATYTSTPTDSRLPISIGGFDEKHQLDAYAAWHGKGVLSAIGRCFDIGSTIRRALFIYASYTSVIPTSTDNADKAMRHIEQELQAEQYAGNGSLMRVLPIGLAYWRDEELAKRYARRSSRTTHPNPMCEEACEVWTGAIVRIMRATASSFSGAEERYSKLDLVTYFAEFPYANAVLREALTLPPGIPPYDAVQDDHEEYYRMHHPILSLINQTQGGIIPKGFSKPIPSAELLSSSGYVLHTLVAALYCFFATETFEEGAILAVNLGNDADTVGAVYAGLAGCWYAEKEGKGAGVGFWSKRVKEWSDVLVKRKLVEEVADELAEFSAKHATEEFP